MSNARAYAAVDEMIRKLQSVDTIAKEFNKAAAKQTVLFIRQQFATSTDPYGHAWKATKAGNKPLIGKTRKLRQWRVAAVTAQRFKLSTKGEAYLGYHDGGTRTIPRRQVTVRDNRLPPKWTKAYVGIAKHLWKKHFR